jgi:hypothetical protein
MTVDIINKINELMSTFNHKQKVIAKSTTVNKNFHFFLNTVNNEQVLFFRDDYTGEIYNFTTFVKKSCNCN